jgi:hypothetical protein
MMILFIAKAEMIKLIDYLLVKSLLVLTSPPTPSPKGEGALKPAAGKDLP